MSPKIRFPVWGVMLLSLFPLAVHAQFNITTLSAKRTDLGSAEGLGIYRFPLIGGSNTVAAQRINTWLQVSVLEVAPVRDGKSAFKAIWPTDGSLNGQQSMDYRIEANRPGYLSLSVSGEYYGAYPSEGSFSYSFDAASGQPIEWRDLFSDDGQKRFLDKVRNERTKRIDDFVAKLPKTGKSHHSADDQETAAMQRDLYSRCREDWRTSDLTYDRFILGAHTLTLIGGHCAPHVIQAIDDLWDFENHYDFVMLKPWLNDYGRCLLIDQRTDCTRPARQNLYGVFHGTVGDRIPITMVFGAFLGSRYFYDKYGALIDLVEEEPANGSYRFTEKPEQGPNATFVLKRQADGRLIGTWTQEGTGKTLSVDLR